MKGETKLPNNEVITEILVRRGLAASLEQAKQMVRDEMVETPQSGGIVINPKAVYRFNEPVRILVDEASKPSSAKRTHISRRESARRASAAARVVTFDPSKQSADRPAAKSGYPRPTSGDQDESPSASTVSGRVSQVDLAELIIRRRETMEVEERIAVALSKGAHVDEGGHTAELVPVRDEFGQISLKLVIR